jgi:hypothetical protein
MSDSALEVLTDYELEDRAQHLGEVALASTYRAAYDDPDQPLDWEYEFVGPVCDGPCDTCITREVLAAAWPVLMELARREVGRDAE